MLSEGAIRWLIPDILECLGGVATKKEIFMYIEDHCNLDPFDDLAKSDSRNEPKFYQRVGNITSHATKTGLSYVEYAEGFALIKNDALDDRNQWLFVLPNVVAPMSATVKQPAYLAAIKKPTFKKPVPATKRVGKNYPWADIEKKKKEVALAGEEFVYITERQWVKDHFPSELSRVEWASQTEGDGLGYDIRSIDFTDPKKTKFIEVKSTTSRQSDTPFYMSPNELAFFQSMMKLNEVLVLYRLYKPSPDYKQFSKKIIMQQELFRNYGFIPNSYRVVKK